MNRLRPARILTALLLCGAAAMAQAQMYKWVGPDGKVNYTDTPPPPTAKAAERKSFNADGSEGPALPYELAQAAQGSPVTLYTTAGCPPCDEGRRLLAARGVPYTEKTVTSNEDIAALKELGATQLPYLVIGRQSQQGMEPGIWHAMLTSAGYPEANRLPRGYRNPAPEAAVPSRAAPKADSRADAKAGERPPAPARADALPAAVGNNVPPGFRF